MKPNRAKDVSDDLTRNTKLRSISFDPETFEAMEAHLDKTGLSRSQFIRKLVEDYLASGKKLPGPNDLPGRRRQNRKANKARAAKG